MAVRWQSEAVRGNVAFRTGTTILYYITIGLAYLVKAKQEPVCVAKVT